MNYRFFTIVFFLFLYGCSGGISGTGDGGPVLPEGNDVSDIGNLPTGADSQVSRFTGFPDQLLLDLPATLRTASSGSDDSNVNSPGVRLRQNISTAMLDAIAIHIDLGLIGSYLETGTGDGADTNTATAGTDFCPADADSACEITDAQISVVADANTEMFANELLAPYPTTLQISSTIGTRSTLRAGDTYNYTNVSLQSGLSGFFDNRLQYSREDGSSITLQWSSDGLLVSVLAQYTDATLHTLLQADTGEMTLRRTDHLRGDASLQLLALQNTAGLATGATYIEADLNDDEPIFSRATGNADVSSIFSESLLADRTRYREATDATGLLTDLETCLDPCNEWQSVLSSQTLPDNFFDSNSDAIDSLSRSISNPIDTSILPSQTDGFVITTGDNASTFAANSKTLADRLACGIQRYRSGIRAFCWQPIPLDDRAYIFTESRANGNTTYTLTTESDGF